MALATNLPTMMRRLDVRLIMMVAMVLVVAIGATLYLIWWIDVNSISTVTTDPLTGSLNVTEETLSVSQILSHAWPLLLLIVVAPALFVIVLFIFRAVRPLHHMAKEVHTLANSSVDEPQSFLADDDLHSLSQSINIIATKLAHTDKLRRNMVNDVAHELRSPLTNIQCQLEAIQDGLVQPDEAMITSLYEETMLLKRLADDLQELALAEAGQLSLKLAFVPIQELLHTAVQAMKPQITATHLTVTLECDDNLPLIKADEERMQQVLRNLLSNAIRHTPPGGQIIVSAKVVEHKLFISVQDSGPGLPPEGLADVFERFYRLDPSRTRQTGGAGLGLAIVKQIVEAHNGRVWAENSLAGGAVFNVWLPIEEKVSLPNKP